MSTLASRQARPVVKLDMNPVRILVDSLADGELRNAQMSNAREIIRRLDPARFHVSVFCTGNPDLTIEQRPNTRLVRLPQQRRSVKILRELIFGQHDILFYVKASPASRLYMNLRRVLKNGCITVGTVESQSDLRDEPTIAPEAVDLWERTVLRCDYLFSNSRYVQQSLKRVYKLPSEVVPTGVDTSFFQPAWGRPANPRVRVLFVGSLRPFKQPQLLLEAAARFSGADFVIIGEGAMAEELEARVRRGRLTNVTLAGGLAAEPLKQQYQQADIFLFPSKWEGSPKVLLEAAACGLPVIARSCYQPESVIHGESGFLVDSDDDLFARLQELLVHSEERRQFGAAGRKRSEQFDWNLITRRWQVVFLDLMSQRTATPAA
jgi:glycosyltransferase involved in cell wall biosynthesis